MNVLRACISLTAAFFLVMTTAAAQQQSRDQQQQEKPKTLEPVTGELLSLDTDSKTLVIKASDVEMKFSFSEETEIVGADKGASGLATSSGATLTVTYQQHGTANVATRIEVKPKNKGFNF